MRPTDPRAQKWDDQPLGREPDKEIARRLGVDPSTVRAARVRRGIPAYRPTTTKETAR